MIDKFNGFKLIIPSKLIILFFSLKIIYFGQKYLYFFLIEIQTYIQIIRISKDIDVKK